jgi:hypothetical protein
MQIASRMSLVKPSATLAISAKALELKAQGVAIIGFGSGEPDFDTPAHIQEAAMEAMKAGTPATPRLPAFLSSNKRSAIPSNGTTTRTSITKTWP